MGFAPVSCEVGAPRLVYNKREGIRTKAKQQQQQQTSRQQPAGTQKRQEEQDDPLSHWQQLWW
jgi:hypothetical protein